MASGHNGPVPLSRADRTIILATSGLLMAAASLFASVLVFATGGRAPTDAGPLYIGPRSDLVRKLDEGSPLYFANPFGGKGFWLDREDGDLVALDVALPGARSCNVRWKGRVDSYVDCEGNRVASTDLARHPVEIARRGERRGSVFVDLGDLDPPPGASSR